MAPSASPGILQRDRGIARANISIRTAETARYAQPVPPSPRNRLQGTPRPAEATFPTTQDITEAGDGRAAGADSPRGLSSCRTVSSLLRPTGSGISLVGKGGRTVAHLQGCLCRLCWPSQGRPPPAMDPETSFNI